MCFYLLKSVEIKNFKLYGLCISAQKGRVNKMKKSILLALTAALLLSAASGCGNKKEVDGKVNLSVGLWPDETQPEALESRNKTKDKFMAENPDINIIPDTYAFDTKTFTMKASAGQLPNLYVTYFTEIQQTIKSGYAADITDVFNEYGYDKYLNPQLVDLCKQDGKIYALPQSVYAQGLYINQKLFKEAGLVNEDGSIMVPQTYDDVAKYAQIIKEKTGKAGYIIPTTNNCGGWHFLNIAWAYGTEFMKQRDDGTWEATFDTQATRDALQWVKDMKWKYNTLVDDTVIDQAGMYKQFAIGNAAMMFSNPPTSVLSTQYGMNIDDIFVTKMPAGPKGRFSQMGGGVYMFSNTCTEDQIRAGFKWLKYTGYNPEITEEAIQSSRESYEYQLTKGEIILDKDAFRIWVDGDRAAKDLELRQEYTNVKPENYEQYYDFNGVTINPEPPACAQQLYAILDKCIQEVITNENANIDELITTANKDFQVNHLDKM